jgi:putative ABC transport system ATP-binding protein
VRSGECVFLAGPSGSGKTTLLSILGGILRPDSGRVLLNGVDVTTLSERERVATRRHHIGFVFQRFHLIRGLNALENVIVPLTLQNVEPRCAKQRGLELLEAVGLSEHTRAMPNKMSTGQCQRVALARALVTDPEILLADEPTASLDETNGQTVMALLRRLTADQGKTAIIVTHDPRIYHFADRVCHMDGGQVVEEVTTEAKTSEESAPLTHV